MSLIDEDVRIPAKNWLLQKARFKDIKYGRLKISFELVVVDGEPTIFISRLPFEETEKISG